MSVFTGTVPAGFGRSLSRKDRKVCRRSLYASLLPVTCSSGCRSCSSVATSADGKVDSGLPEDLGMLHREELLQLYLEEQVPGGHRNECEESTVQRLRNAFHFVTASARDLLVPREDETGQQRSSCAGHGKLGRDGEGGFVSDHQQSGKKERKNRLFLASVAQATRCFSTRYCQRLKIGKRKGTFLVLPLCAAGAFLFALILLWLYAENVEEISRGPVLLHTESGVRANLVALTSEEELQRANEDQQQKDLERHRGKRGGNAGKRISSTRAVEHHGRGVQSSAGHHRTAGNEGYVRMPVRRRRHSDTGATSSLSMEVQQHLMLALNRHQKKLPLMEPGAPTPITPLQTDVIIRDFMNSQYIVELGVGTPPQAVRAIADTGSSDFWTCSEKCGVFCMLHKVYHHGKSSSYKPNNAPYNITYVGGPVSGFLSVDNVAIGDLQTKQVLFAEAENVKGLGPAFFFGHFDGVLGMGLPATSTHGLKPLMQTAIEQQLLKRWVFAFYLSSDDSVDGELTLGGYDANRVDGSIVYSPLIDSRYWMINSQGLRVKNDLISKTTKVIVDSGTTLIAGPLDEVEHIAQMFGAFTVPMIPKGTFLISCEEALVLEDLELMIEGHIFSVRAADLVIKVSDVKGVPCLFGIIGLEILEGRAQHRNTSHTNVPAPEVEKVQFDTLRERAAGRQGNLLARLLAEEALLAEENRQSLQQLAQGEPDAEAFTTLSGSKPEGAAPSGAADGERLRELGRLWIFGDVFMRGAYTIFDYDRKRIGFAKLNYKPAKKQNIHSME